jgi:agmatinase
MSGGSKPATAGQSENDDEGLPTFSSRDWVATAAGLAQRRPDVAIVGAPMDINTTYRPGARFGPKYMRSNAYDPGTYHLDLGLDIFEWLACCTSTRTPTPRTASRGTCTRTAPRCAG